MMQSKRYSMGEDPIRRKQHSTWYRGPNCNFIPSKRNMKEQGAIDKYILKGWVPPRPAIKPDDSILAVGSCFAQHIVSYLRRQRPKMTINEGTNVNLFAFGAGFVNTYTLRQQFEWALGQRDIKTATLYVEDPDYHLRDGLHRFRLMPLDEAQRARSRAAIMQADAFLLTLGLSEVWYERDSGEVFFGAVPSEKYDPDRHAFRTTSVEENYRNLLALYQLLRSIKPEAPIIFTLSPVTLTATFRPVSCLTANVVSKATLRVAVDMLVDPSTEVAWAREPDVRVREPDPLLFYWPSYEIVTEYYGLAGYKEDRRHPHPAVVDHIMQLFEKYFVGKRRRRQR